MFKKNRLKAGNLKLSKGTLIFDLPAVKSCPNSSSCHKTCYARKMETWPYIKKWRDTNFTLAKNPERLFNLLYDQLSKTKKRYIRIHSSGDFFNQEYVNLWIKVAKEFPDKMFYSYTKAIKILDFNSLKKLPNVNMFDSFIRGKLNYGPREYIEKLARQSGAFICPHGYSGEKITCGEGCSHCMEKGARRVVFLQH